MTDSGNRRFGGQGSLVRRLVLGGALASGLALGGVAHADDYDDASRQLVELDQRIGALSVEFKDAPAPDPQAADRRVVEALTLIELKSYAEASTLLLDVVERYPNTRAYDDAIVLLGESLYQNRDLISARRYFEQAVKKNTGSRKEQQALNKLIEISLKTGDFDNIDEYLSRLSKIPQEAQDPAVPYVRGKYYFFRDKLDDSLAAFNAIGPSNPYYLQARYFIATLEVKRGDLAAAATGFDAVLKIQPRNDSETDVQDLARLAIGRILYERGQFDKAKEAYEAIGLRSRSYDEARNELAWNAIKAKDFKAAYRQLDLLLLRNPDSAKAPELRLLMGNLNLRLANFYLASETFTKTRDEFEPIHNQLTASLNQGQNDPKYFDTLIGGNIDKFDIALFVPPGAAKWLKDEPDVAKMLVLVGDVGDLRKGIKEADDLLVRLEKAVNGQGKVGIFPDLAASFTQSSEVLNQTLAIRKKFATRARALAQPYLQADEKLALDQNAAERAALEQSLQDVPLTAEDLKSRDKSTKGQLESLDKQASEMNVQIHSLEAEITAIEHYYSTSRTEQKIKPEDLSGPLADAKKMLVELHAAYDQVRTQIAEAQRDATAAGAGGAAEHSDVIKLSALMKTEYEILGKARGRMNPSSLSEFDAISNLLTRTDAVQTKVVTFDERVDKAAETRLATIREKLASEKTQLEAVAGQLNGVVSESQNLGGGLAQAMLRKVTDRFYDIVVQSDVGIIDVAWGLKDQKTQNLSKLINQQKLEIKAVDDDFKALLQEEEK